MADPVGDLPVEDKVCDICNGDECADDGLIHNKRCLCGLQLTDDDMAVWEQDESKTAWCEACLHSPSAIIKSYAESDIGEKTWDIEKAPASLHKLTLHSNTPRYYFINTH